MILCCCNNFNIVLQILQVKSILIFQWYSHQQHCVILFASEIHSLATPAFIFVRDSSPLAFRTIHTLIEQPELFSKSISTITHYTVVVFPVIFAKLDIAVKAITVEIKSFISFMQFHFSIPRLLIEPLKILLDQHQFFLLYIYF